MDSNNNNIIDAALGEQDVGKLLNDLPDDDLLKYAECKLDPQQKVFFGKDQQQFHKNYPNVSKLLRVLRMAHCGIEAILQNFVGNVEIVEGKTTKDTAMEVQKILQDIRKVIRNVWTTAKTSGLRHAFRRFLEFSLERYIGNNKLMMKDFLFIMAILKHLLELLINAIENGNEKLLLICDQWLGKVADALDEILKSDAFKGIAVSAAGAGVFVVGANVGLAALGFTTAGVQAGSIAAAWMSSIGSVSSGSLFAMLQSAGVVGFGLFTTGGIALVGAGVGFLLYQLVKVSEFRIKVYVELADGKLTEPENVQLFSDTIIEDLLCQYIPADIPIPKNVDSFDVQVYDPLKNKKLGALRSGSKSQNALRTIGFNKALVIAKSNSTSNRHEVPFHVKRNGLDLWNIEDNTVDAMW